MIDLANISDGQVLSTLWKPGSLRVFREALDEYLRKIRPEQSPGNTKVNNEIQDVINMKRRFAQLEREADGEYDHVELVMEGTYYKLLSDVLHKYWSYKTQILKEKKEKSTVQGAFEGEETYVENIRSILQNELFIKIPRRKALVESLYPTESLEGLESENIKQQVSIGNVYGQVVLGHNYGTMRQEVPKELLESLQELFKLISEDKTISEEMKNNSLGDIQTAQAQLMKSKPSKTILSAATKSLSVLADTSQVGEIFAKLVTPHLDKINGLINSLPF